MDQGIERAAVVREALVDLWGDDMPPTPDPVLSILCDAVAVDDQHGAAVGLVVQGDGLTVTALADLMAAGDAATGLAFLPAPLRERIGRLLPEPREAPEI